ncbi:MAG TPA: YoaK family protein [Holophagaceae bacterium]
MRRIPRYLRVITSRYLGRLLKGRLEGKQLQAAVEATLATLPFQEKLLVREGALRSDSLNRQLAWAMAFVAGAVNAGGFLAVGHYTSHMTGVASTLADMVALGDLETALAALAMMLSFMGGAFLCTTLISFGQRRRMRSRYALTLLLEAGLLLVFGLMGARLETEIRFTLPTTVMLLCFIMGMHNAVTSIISGAAVRTTHMTGTVTDIGIELSRLAYVNRHQRPGRERIVANRQKLVLLLLLLVSFVVGGVTGALAFKHVGYKATIPLAIFLCFLAARPLLVELQLLLHRIRKQWE